MTLGNPFGLIGLLSLPVILALHLLHRRQRRYVVSHLGLWNFLETQARGPRARRIPITLILLLDLLAGALLSLAWAQPRITLIPPARQPQNLVILLDVSSSMRATDEAGLNTRFDRAKLEVSALIKGIGPQDVVTILGFGQHARLIGASRHASTLPAGSPQQLAEQIDSATAGETGTSSALTEALALGQAALDTSLPVEFHIVTDGDFPLDSDTLGALNKFAYPLRWHLVGGSANNQAVIELNATPLAQNQLQVFTRIANFSNQNSMREATLQVDGRQVDQAVIDLPANSTVPHIWQVPNKTSGNPSTVVVSLQGKDKLAEDDTASIGLLPGGNIRVALVAEPAAQGSSATQRTLAAPGTLDAIQQAVQAIPGVDLEVISPADYAAKTPGGEQSPYALTIFRNYLPPTWPAGVVLVVDPPVESARSSVIPGTGAPSLYAQAERVIPASAITQASAPDPLVDGIDFSGVRWARVWALAGDPPGFTPLLQADVVPILLQGEINPAAAERSQTAPGHSRVVVLLADLATGNFTKHPAFPILIANLVESARQAPLPTGFKTGEALPLPEPSSYQSITITPPNRSTVELGSSWPPAWTNTLEPGLYRFLFTRTDRSRSEFYTGASAGDAAESDLRPRDWTGALATGSSLSGAKPASEEQQIDLRPWLLGSAILALMVETTLAWRR